MENSSSVSSWLIMKKSPKYYNLETISDLWFNLKDASEHKTLFEISTLELI